MKVLLSLIALTVCTGCVSRQVKNSVQKAEWFKDLQSLSYNEDYLYISFTAVDRGQDQDPTEHVRWARMPLERIWKRARPKNPKATYMADYPDSVSYRGQEYDILYYRLNERVSESSEHGWEILVDKDLISPIQTAVSIQKEKGSQIDPQNSIFGESDSNTFLFSYPDKDPQIVLLNRESHTAVVVWSFNLPSGYEFTPSGARGVESVLMPLATTIDVISLPVVLPAAIMTFDGGK